ncbi:MAG: flagellar biosynthesis anti-sigma factor FlgM [Mariniblastus sp.]|jgi:negative regulator of flagellin synthesis FlgM|nr:flagellar biosynthesis anti-sigma factor FlgM [Mariniblastus sp.]
MQIRRTTNIQSTNAVNLETQNKVSTAENSSTAPVDQLEISAEAQRISQTGDVRADRVADIRAQIANGQYESPEKINSAVDRMLDEFG